MSPLECYCPHLVPVSTPVKVRVRCEYDDGEAPTEVCFVADRSLGRTRAAVHAEILRRLATLEEFDLPALGEPIPIPFFSATVRRVTVF